MSRSNPLGAAWSPSHQSTSVWGSTEQSLQAQLTRYAEDFRELAARYEDLERRHEKLKAASCGAPAELEHAR